MRKIPVVILLAGFAALSSASYAGEAAKPAAPTQSAAPAPAAFNGGTGTVLETAEAGRYTYVKVDMGGTAIWAAAPQFKVEKGQTVKVPAGAPMYNFQSNTLKRKFDVVYFVSKCEVVGDAKTKP